MPDPSCVYVVTYVPPGCTAYALDDIVTTACSEPCVDRVINGGACSGTYLTSVSEACMVYPPEGAASAADFEGATANVDTSRKATAVPLDPSLITGRYPKAK